MSFNQTKLGVFAMVSVSNNINVMKRMGEKVKIRVIFFYEDEKTTSVRKGNRSANKIITLSLIAVFLNLRKS